METQLIVLDGPIASGKTSIAETLQKKLLPQQWLYFSEDTLINTQPLPVRKKTRAHKESLFLSSIACVKALIEAGHFVIFESAISKSQNALKMELAFEGVERFYVGLHCELNELEKRIFDRGDKTVEEARHDFGMCPYHLNYDLELDSTTTSVSELATIIAATLNEATAKA
ncbi:chloramphenicol phosphotransferase CPT family protein [Enterovibrio paralichthyis]|uniref:chloramphenicol phosphotransferase CPT family protein n=1 Tax=Enterovibrio paralichthyis TaxID=2853805 RepID=UPI001C44DB77|nr:chloramphenicol phosphotransferase CPT family protein [Enterovibrio paralichthyis]MBV7296842.1 chloramphenicol phosphotransferase CPT family protein [Enterovibrio paralichthyis]